MSLKYKLDTLEGLDEATAKLYKKDGDKFILDVDDSGAKSALQAERDRANAAERALKEREANEAKAKADAEKAQLEAKGEWDKLKASVEAEKAELAKKLQDTTAAHERHLMESKALALLAPLAATPKTLALLTQEFIGKLEVVKGEVLVKGDPGLTPEKLAEKFTTDNDYAPLLKGSGASGGGAPSAGPGGMPAGNAAFFDPKNPNYNYTKQMELAKANPKEFEALRAQFPPQ